MKKWTHILLLMVYLPAATGVSINVHYCCGSYAGVDVFATKRQVCGCGMKMPGNCCSDEWSFVRLQDDSQESRNFHPFVVKAAAAKTGSGAVNEYRQMIPDSYEKHNTYESYWPPGNIYNKIFIRISVFRI